MGDRILSSPPYCFHREVAALASKIGRCVRFPRHAEGVDFAPLDCGKRTSVKIGTEDQWLRLHRADAPESDAVLKGPVALSVTARAWRIRDAQGHEPAVEGLETIELSPCGCKLIFTSLFLENERSSVPTTVK